MGALRWVRRLGLMVCLLGMAAVAQGQNRTAALSDGEVEKLRESATEYPERVLLFSEFLDQRAKQITALATGKRHPGREEDLHDLMEQFTSIAEDLEDNLDDYGPKHKDVRKALPKLLAAADRWATALKTPAEDASFTVSRKLALQSIDDLRGDVTKLLEEQKAWFLAHPPAKAGDRGKG